MQIGWCASATGQAVVIRNSGLDFLEENVQQYLAPEGPEGDFTTKRLAVGAVGVPVRVACCFLPGSLRCVGPQVDRPRLMKYAETAFRRAAAAGIDTIVFGSGGARKLPPPPVDRSAITEQFCRLLADLGPVAQQHRLTLVVEPLNRSECDFITSVAEGAAIVRQVQHPAIRLLADLYHMRKDGEGPESLAAHGDLLAHVHVAEVQDRAAPGTHGEDLRPWLKALKNTGYDRRISLECRMDHPERNLKPSLAALRGQLRDAGY